MKKTEFRLIAQVYMTSSLLPFLTVAIGELQFYHSLRQFKSANYTQIFSESLTTCNKSWNLGQLERWRAPSMSRRFNALCTFHHTSPYKYTLVLHIHTYFTLHIKNWFYIVQLLIDYRLVLSTIFYTLFSLHSYLITAQGKQITKLTSLQWVELTLQSLIFYNTVLNLQCFGYNLQYGSVCSIYNTVLSAPVTIYNTVLYDPVPVPFLGQIPKHQNHFLLLCHLICVI